MVNMRKGIGFLCLLFMIWIIYYCYGCFETPETWANRYFNSNRSKLDGMSTDLDSFLEHNNIIDFSARRDFWKYTVQFVIQDVEDGVTLAKLIETSFRDVEASSAHGRLALFVDHTNVGSDEFKRLLSTVQIDDHQFFEVIRQFDNLGLFIVSGNSRQWLFAFEKRFIGIGLIKSDSLPERFDGEEVKPLDDDYGFCTIGWIST